MTRPEETRRLETGTSSTATTCPHCGGPMVRSYARACGRGGSAFAVDLGAYCPSESCRIQRAADRAARDEAAIAGAIEAGLIVPDDTPEADRYQPLPLHRTEAGYPTCSTCDGSGCPDCTDPA